MPKKIEDTPVYHKETEYLGTAAGETIHVPYYPATVSEAPMALDGFSLDKPSSLVKLASTMQSYIEKQGLFSTIQSKRFPNVEAWQFVGLSLGIIPVIKEVKNISTDPDKFKYQATVELRNIVDNNLMGMGVAIASNGEPTKKGYQEYAIASLSQTRAVSKAYRLLLSFLMKSAGFEATPSEEMESEETQDLRSEVARLEGLLLATHTDMMYLAISLMEKSSSRDEFVFVWTSYPQFQEHKDFRDAATRMGVRFPKPVKVDAKQAA